MAYQAIANRLRNKEVVILDGGTGTELERRGAHMDAEAWCGPAALEHFEVLKQIHLDYIAAGADVITANTFASSRLMLGPAGLADRFEEINRLSVTAALEARKIAGAEDRIAIAGSLSHMLPMAAGEAFVDPDRATSDTDMRAGFAELADLLKAAGCDFIMTEMMYHPDRMTAAFDAATGTGLPVWAGFSARAASDGSVVSFTADQDIPFHDVIAILNSYSVDAAGVMHTPSNVIGDALKIIRSEFSGPLTAYPDSGYFKMPKWQFEDVIEPNALCDFAEEWIEQGAQAIGGCCGLSPHHIASLNQFKSVPNA